MEKNYEKMIEMLFEEAANYYALYNDYFTLAKYEYSSKQKEHERQGIEYQTRWCEYVNILRKGGFTLTEIHEYCYKNYESKRMVKNEKN